MSEPRDEQDELQYECELPQPPEQVWRALTEPELLAAWLMPNDFRAERGARFQFAPDDALHGPIECEVLRIEPPKLLRFSWREQDSQEESVVSFQLRRSAAGGTHLSLTHARWAQDDHVGQLLVGTFGGGANRTRCAA